jgi:hypothetical protein
MFHFISIPVTKLHMYVLGYEISNTVVKTVCSRNQGCQMVCFQTKNPNLGKFWRALQWNILVCFTVIWHILWPFGNVVVIWYIFPRFGTVRQEKSGNPGLGQSKFSRSKSSILSTKKTSSI